MNPIGINWQGETVAKLGFGLRRMEWGQGLASEGASALTNWGFKNGRYDKIFACTMVLNHASHHVFEKIGLNYVRTIHVDWPDRFPGIEEGEVQYELMRSGWNGINLI